MNRRQFLGRSALATAGLTLPLRQAHASVSGSDLRFIFINNYGGWDPTRVFAPEFSNDHVAMEPLAEAQTVGDLVYVRHPDRPSVDAFFTSHGEQSLVINGMQVRSIAHEICAMIALTGSTSGLNPDWATVLGHAQQDRYTLPTQLGSHLSPQVGFTHNRVPSLLSCPQNRKSDRNTVPSLA